MPTQLQFRRGSSAENDAFTGALGELTVDTSTWDIRVHDGVTVGGHSVGGASNLANNLAGGVAGSIPYQNSPGVTQFIPIGASDTVLVSNGTTATWQNLGTLSANGGVNADNILVQPDPGGLKYLLLAEGSGSYVIPYINGDSGPTFNTSTGVDINSTLSTAGPIHLGGHIIPDTNLAYDLGSSSYKFRDIYLSSGTIYIGSSVIRGTGTTGLTTNGAEVLTTASAASTTVGFATTATNLAGGTVDGVAIQTDVGVTGFITASTSTVGNTLVKRDSNGDFNSRNLKLSGSTHSNSTNTGALTVEGGVGIGGGLVSGGTVTATNFSGNLSGNVTGNLTGNVTGNLTGIATTATNIQGGTSGQLTYQTAAGTTGFVGPGTAGQILVSAGTSAPTYTNTGSLYVANSVNAEKWLTPRTFTFGGDLTGSMVVDGSQDITFTATIAADSVALGTDTSGNYVATGATSGFGLSGSANTEGSTFTVTSNATSSNTANTIIFRDANGDFAAGGATFSRAVTFSEPVTFSGTATFVYSTNTVYTDNIINIHTPPGGNPSNHVWTSDDGKDIGLIFHYYKSATDKDAFLGLANDTGYLEWYSNGTESGGIFTGTTYGTVKTGGLILAGGTANSGNSTTGDLTVTGGVGIGGGLFVGGIITATTFIGAMSGTATSANNINGGTAGQLVYQSAAGTTGFVGPGTAGQILVSAGTSAPTYTSTASIYVGTAVNTEKWLTPRTFTFGGDLTGSMVVDGSQNVTFTATIAANSVALGTDTTGDYVSNGATSGFGLSGSTTGEGQTFTVTANSTSVNTVSTIVFRDSSGNFSAGTITASLSGTASSANNLTGGTAGAVVFQSAAGTTAYSSGTTGQLLVATTNSTPTFTSTGSIYVQDSVNTSNIRGGGQGQMLYQSLPGVTSFTNSGTTGQFLQATTNGAPVFTNTSSMYVNSAVNAEKIFGGTAGQLVYQSGAGTTAFAGPGTAGQILVSAGTSAPTYTNTGSIYVGTAVNAEKWLTPRTFTFGGDLSGSMVVDGSQNVTFTATIAADSVALGTDTSGNYVAAGATSGFGLSGSASTEGSTFTVTANSTSANTVSTIVFRDGNGDFSARTLTLTGDLVVQGTTVTVNSTVTNVSDPIMTIGSGPAGAAPSTDDNKDRGIAFQWHNGSAAKVGFFGYDDSTGYLTFVPDATITNEVVSGAQGDIQATNFRGALVGNADTATSAGKWTTARTFTFGGDLTGSMVVDGSQNVTFTATIASDSVALGTDTTGNYVATATAGTGISVAGSGVENAAITITNLGVTALTGGGGVTVSASTGSVTLGFTTSTLVQTASNLAGGAAGNLHYQSGAGASAFLANGSANQILTQGATNPQWTSASAITGVGSVANSLTIGSGLSGGSYNGSAAVTITNSDTGSAQNIYKNISDGTTTAAAGSNNDTIKFRAGSGITVAVGSNDVTHGDNVLITNSGVTSNVAGTGITVSGATGAVTITNAGVTSITGTTNQVTASAGTGAVTLSLPQSINTAASVQFGSFGVGTAASGTSGEIRATNEITAYYGSDINLKENIVEINDALIKIDQIRGVSFDWTEENIKSRGGEDGYFVRKHDVGVIAQEIQKVLPEVVAKREDGYLAVKYEKMVPLLIQAIKEQQKQINQLSMALDKLINK